MNYGGEVGWVFIMDRKQNTQILHDFIFNDIEPDESQFDYSSLREALSEYRTGEWIENYQDDYEDDKSSASVNNQEDDEDIIYTGDWE